LSTPTCASAIEQRSKTCGRIEKDWITELKALADPYNPRYPLVKLEDDIALIEAGLTKLNTAATG